MYPCKVIVVIIGPGPPVGTVLLVLELLLVLNDKIEMNYFCVIFLHRRVDKGCLDNEHDTLH